MRKLVRTFVWMVFLVNGQSALHIIDMTGRSIMEIEFNQQLESSDVKVVDLRGYPPGVYYLRCTWLKDNTIFYRFILQ